MRIAIVGAGPAGASLAHLLARRGVDVVLVERERDFARVFRGEGLMPTGIDALKAMGLGALLDELPSRTLECWEIHLDRQFVSSIPEQTAELGDRALRTMPQPPLLTRILDEAGRSPSFRFEAPRTFREVLRDGGRVRGVRASSPDGDVEIEADFVIGCDGRASAVRRRGAGLALELLPEHYDMVWMKFPRPPELEGRSPFSIFAAGPEAAIAYVSWDDRWQVGWMLDKGTWKGLRDGDWLARCAALFTPQYERHLLDHRDEIEGPSVLDVMVGSCPSWSAPGILLLGDAAHPMSPIRAQGINMALRDAIVAANHLVPALEEGADLGEASRAIQAERDREILRVQKLQFNEARGQRWARERPRLMAPALKVAPYLMRTDWMKKLWLRQQRPLRFGITNVRLEV